MMNTEQQKKQSWLAQKIKNTVTFKNTNITKGRSYVQKRKLQEDNPVYRALKHQRDTKTILDFILGQPSNLPLRKKGQKFARTRFYLSEPHTVSVDDFVNSSKKHQQKQDLRQRALNLVSGTKQVGQALVVGKRRLNTLHTYNKIMERYYNHLPPNPQDGGKNESFVSNENLVKLCNQDTFPTQNIHHKAKQMLKYNQPKLDPRKMREIRFRCRTTTSLAHKVTKRRAASVSLHDV